MKLVLAGDLGFVLSLFKSSARSSLQRGGLSLSFEPVFFLILVLIFALKKKEPTTD
jgi:hypothetical protein